MSLEGSLKAFRRAARFKHRTTDACAILLERDDLSAEDRDRVTAFRLHVGGKSISEFNEDGSLRVCQEIRTEVPPFLAAFGVKEEFGYRP